MTNSVNSNYNHFKKPITMTATYSELNAATLLTKKLAEIKNNWCTKVPHYSEHACAGKM